MPLTDMGGGCWKWGNKGKKYCGKGAKHKALMQGYVEDPKHFKEEVGKGKSIAIEDVEELITAGLIDRYDYYSEAYVSQKERDKMPDSEFGDPKNKRFPVKDEKHFKAAVKLLGRIPANERPAIKARLKKIAEKHGWKIPDNWA